MLQHLLVNLDSLSLFAIFAHHRKVRINNWRPFIAITTLITGRCQTAIVMFHGGAYYEIIDHDNGHGALRVSGINTTTLIDKCTAVTFNLVISTGLIKFIETSNQDDVL
jgi:hypothetical protein